MRRPAASRSGIALLSMLATVVHLACGCCLHVGHFASSDQCCEGEASEGHEAACSGHDGCCPDVASFDHGGHQRSGPGDALDHDGRADHRCHACTCAVVPAEPDDELLGPPPVACVAGFPEAAVTSCTAPRSGVERCRPPSQSEQRSPLFERLLV